MKPTKYNLEIYQGDDYSLNFNFRDSLGNALNLTGRTYRAQVRQTAGSQTILATFTFDLTNASSGVIVMHMSDQQSALLPEVSEWDLEQIDSQGRVRTLFVGRVKSGREVTRG